jgi:predicted GNAT family acetyltransferase
MRRHGNDGGKALPDGALRPPAGVSGLQRAASHNDKPVLVDWVEHFFVETFSHQRDDAAWEQFVDNANAVGDRFVLWDDRGMPVSMAMLRAPSAGVSRIGPVFMPRSARGHGHGAAVTAAAAELARRSGVNEVVLFADLANPPSNGIYQRIGFEPVSDSVRIDFAAAR